MLNSHEELIQFVLEQSATQPLARRAVLFRSLAEIVGNPEDTKRLRAMADEMEQANLHCEQFAFQFSHKGVKP